MMFINIEFMKYSYIHYQLVFIQANVSAYVLVYSVAVYYIKYVYTQVDESTQVLGVCLSGIGFEFTADISCICWVLTGVSSQLSWRTRLLSSTRPR